MHHVIIQEADTYEVAILIKEKALKRVELIKHYVEPIGLENVIGFSLAYNEKDKAPAALKLPYLQGLLKALDSLGVKTLLIADSDYFKYITKVKKITGKLGYVVPCALKGYEHMNCILVASYKSLYYKPENQEDIDLSLKTLYEHVGGTHQEIGIDIIHSESYPKSYSTIKKTLASLHQYDELDCDIEAFSLKFWEAGIATIEFNWDKHNGIAFPVDYTELPEPIEEGDFYGKQEDWPEVKALLKKFFIEYKGKLNYHNANYDVKVLIYELFMDNLLDQKGLLEGLEVMTKNIDDTKVIAYLATNSTSGNNLALKHLAHEFAGDYAQEDIDDVRKIPLDKLLRYNLTDGLCTRYVKEKNYPIMVQDEQLDVYNTIMKPSIKSILQIELTGMCLDMPRVLEVKKELEGIREKHRKNLFESKVIKDFIYQSENDLYMETNDAWKKKFEPREYFTGKFDFNPNSGPQLQDLIYKFLGYEVIDRTKGKAPATGAKTIKKILANSKCQEHTDMLEALNGLAGVGIIIDTFINAFLENSVLKDDGMYYLHGSFNIGGTVSGRLSSSQPNLQNIPSGSQYAKLIKSCFCAPPAHVRVDKLVWHDIIAPLKIIKEVQDE